MALTAAQVDILKSMIKQTFIIDPDFAVTGLLNILTDAQEETVYDFLRIRILRKLDDRLLVAQRRLTDAENDINVIPPRI
jgi:hypothetical protein